MQSRRSTGKAKLGTMYAGWLSMTWVGGGWWRVGQRAQRAVMNRLKLGHMEGWVGAPGPGELECDHRGINDFLDGKWA